MGTEDSTKKALSPTDVDKFIAGELGDHYLSILIPNDDIYSELHAKKADMKKKGAIFEITRDGKGVSVKIEGTFKVTAYSHVIDRIKSNADEIYVAGIYCGDWPPFGGNFAGVDADKKKFPVKGVLV